MKTNKIHIFDLDGTLWNIDTKVWIIDKEEPHKPLIRIDNYEVNRIINGLFKNDNIKIQYNGNEFYISSILYDKINKKYKLPIERLGISWIEFYDEKYLNNTKMEFLENNIKHLRNNIDYICIVSEQSKRNKFADVLNNLRKKLKNINIEIFKIYFIGDKLYFQSNENNSLKKLHLILEHLIGLKIENGKFVPFKQDYFNEVYFYDDDIINFNYINNIQNVFENVLKNSNDDMFKIAIEKLNNKPILYNNLITNNLVNIFETKKIELVLPISYPIKKI